MIEWFAVALMASASAGQFDHRVHVEGFGQRRDVNQRGFSPPRVLTEGFALGDYTGTWTGQNVFIELKPQARGVWSQGVGVRDPRAVTVATSPRWLDARRLVGRTSDQELFVDLDRANARYRGGPFEIYAGRRPISLGALTLIPIWNKLTLPLVFRAGPEWIENPDGAGGTVTWDDLRVRLIHVRSSNAVEDLITLAEAKYVWRASEFQALGGSWWGYRAAGLTASTDLLGATMKFEGLHLQKSGDEILQWGASVERALGSRWTVDVEFLHQSRCATARARYGLAPLTRFQVLNGCDYVFPLANVQVGSAWRIGVGLLTNVHDPSAMAIANVDYAWTDDVNLEFKAKQTLGREASEFGPKRMTDPFGRTVGAPSTVYLGFSYTH